MHADEWLHYILAALVGLVTIVSPALAQEKGLRRQLLDEYRPAYQELVKRYGRGSFSIRMEADGGPEMLQVTDLVGKMTERGFAFTNRTRFVSRHAGTTIRETDVRVEAGNDFYHFALRKAPPGRFALQSVDKHGPKREQSFAVMAMPFADWIAGRTLLSIISDPVTELHSISAEEFNGHAVRALRISTRTSAIGGNAVILTKMTYFFRPEQGWICVGFRSEPSEGQSFREFVASYGEEPHLPSLRRVEMKVCNALESPSSRVDATWHVVEFDPDAAADTAEFFLSHFGLPEPYGVEWERPTPWWLYALISAGVLFVVAVLVSFWKRRLTARQSA